MKKPILLLSLMAALASTQTFAQDDAKPAEQPAEAPVETPADTAVETPAEDTPAVGGNLDLGEDASAAQEGPYIRETHGDWALQCAKIAADSDEEMCQMYQLLKDSSGANVAEASIFKLKPGGKAVAGGNIVAPLETLLTQGLTIQIDSSKPRKYEFSFCNPIGCFARVGFTKEDVAAFKRGAIAKVSIVPALAPDQRVTVDMSLKGFTATYDLASELKQ